ncbi:hypothetical protein CI109_101700 [Kwoniella shandongensis]|uniref:Uncharacterized protein n=1 Tax=Kwoniella shandongensis TaxID=1734106 RepID=A0A5M6C5J4_9TREE|nr:uncharacterized protein CI109_001177 [Kwoniella shandongensis]KAA5530374.1 hypothetical protein CI109_001177 [Kwoniella shandongensis]
MSSSIGSSSSSTLQTLLSHAPAPQFIYLHHPHHPSTQLPPIPESCHVARIDTVEYHTPRLLLSGILNKFSGGADDVGEVNTWDGFSLKLREWWSVRKNRKGKGKAIGNSEVNGNARGEEMLVVMITKAERLRLVLGNGWTVITRLSELTGVPCTVLLTSTAPWDHVRPHRADAPEPIHVYLAPPTREDILAELLPGSSHPLFPRFLDLLLSTVLPLVTPPISELHYLAQSLWPIYTSTLPPHLEMTELRLAFPDPENPPEPLNVTLKLLTDLKHQLSLSLAAAIENLIPRQLGGFEFTQAMTPGPGKARILPKPPSLELPLAARFLLIGGYCASYNPAKSDVRLFGRGAGVGGKRKKGGGTRRAGYGRTRIGKVPQRLLGPKPFPLDRLLAIFGSIYAEHAPRPQDLQATYGGESSSDEETDELDGWLPIVAEQAAKAERRTKRDREREEKWDEEVEALMMSVKFWGMIPELEAQGLLKRVSPPDRLDNVMLRCEIDYETAKTLAKDLKITLDEYLYEAIM